MDDGMNVDESGNELMHVMRLALTLHSLGGGITPLERHTRVSLKFIYYELNELELYLE